MKKAVFFILLILSFISFGFSSTVIKDNVSFNGTHLLGTITTERVLIDGIWWIIVYEDGVKTKQYIDPNQD